VALSAFIQADVAAVLAEFNLSGAQALVPVRPLRDAEHRALRRHIRLDGRVCRETFDSPYRVLRAQSGGGFR
jgi:hypothetical protein